MDLLFTFPDHEQLAESLVNKLGVRAGKITLRHFPDGETFVQVHSDVKGKNIGLICSLDQADKKVMALMFFAHTARELGAESITLIAPYLGYMRQDKRFNEGEAVTSRVFAKFISSQFESLVTIDPHLHRYKSLQEIYSIPCTLLHATQLIARWVQNNVSNPVLIGPDEESRQWVSEVASKAEAPFMILEKKRFGDREVEISMPSLNEHINKTPVLIDDIISTARTMIKASHHLHELGGQSPVCIGVHAVFAGDAYEMLQAAKISRIVTCNTINHPSNEIDVCDLLVKSLS